MNWKRKSSKGGLLYLILDKKVIDQTESCIESIADKSTRLGVDMFQLRAKNLNDKEHLSLAKRLVKIIHKRKKILIINDRADIAYLSGADGLHLGEEDLSVKEARKILGKTAIVGKTIHHLKELKSAVASGLNYISVGPVFKSATKPALKPLTPEKLKALINKNRKLTFAIGGINQYNVNSLLESGIRNIAVCRDIILAKDLTPRVKKYKRCLRKVS